MFKSIFGRQFAAFAASLVFSFLVLGFVLSGLLESYFFDRQIMQLEERGAAVAQSYIQSVQLALELDAVTRGIEIMPGVQIFNAIERDRVHAQFISAVTHLNNYLAVINQYFGASSFMVDAEMTVLFATEDITSISVGQTLDVAELQQVTSGEAITVRGNIGGIFNERVLTVGYPIMLDTGDVLGAIFMNVSLEEIEGTITDVVLFMFICLMAALVVSFVIAFFVSRSISKPIKQISDAAMVISGGNFDKRIDLKSGGEVGRLAHSFNHMAESLDSHERTRREFISNISHDLRSPLTSMRGFLTAIIDGTISADEQGRYLNIVLDETDRLTKLTNNILEANKFIEGGVMLNCERFNINELLKEVLFTFEAKINEKQISISIELGEEYAVYADIQAIRRVIVNLVDNAVKFANSKIVVKTYIVNAKIYVSIEDDGRGVSADDQKRVFERFYKADASRGEDRMGSGLGLAIVWEFIKAHGESVEIISQPGQGCEVVFSLERV